MAIALRNVGGTDQLCGNSRCGSAATTITCTFPNEVAADSVVLVVVTEWEGTPDTVSRVTKSAGTATIGTVTCENHRDDGASTAGIGIFRIPITGSGTLTVQYATDGGASHWMGIAAGEFTGVATSNWAGQVDTNTGSGTNHTTNSISNTTGGLLIVGFSEVTSAHDTRGDYSGTLIYQEDDGSNCFTFGAQFKITTGTPTTVTETISESGTWWSAAAEYLPTAVSSLSLSVSDTIGVSETATAIISGPGVGVFDLMQVSDSVSAIVAGPCSAGVSDTVNISDSVSVALSSASWQVSGRHLIDGNGDPVLLIIRSPQGLAVTASTTQMDTYCSTISSQGYNCIQVHAIAGTTFGGGSNFETYDSIHPFSTDGDISTPNSTYFSRLDTLVTTANSYDIYVMLNAAECIDALSLWKTNGNTKCYNWGAYLGNRYKDDPNIIWMVGNDFQTWESDQDAVDALVNVINGIQSVDSNHTLFTAWLEYYKSASRDSDDFDAECTLDFAYTYYVAYDLVETEYALTPAKPIFLGESYYENYDTLGITGTAAIIRKQNYWAMLAGACGVCYNSIFWQPVADGWQDDLDITGAIEMGYLKSLFEAYSWWLLVPDTSHSVMTAGYGTKETGTTKPPDSSYANCACASDGSVLFAYLPTSRQVTIDMTSISGSNARARWFDPTDGTYTAIAVYPPTGTRNFTPDTGDWVLVIDAVSGPSAAVAGTATENVNEGDIVSPSETIVITLTGDTFVPS